MPSRYGVPLLATALVIGSAVYIGLLGGLTATMAIGIYLGVVIMSAYEAIGAVRSREVASPVLHSLDDLYSWMLRYGDPVVVMLISEQIRASAPESMDWAVEEVGRLCRERHAVPSFEFRVSRHRPFSDDWAMLRIWLFGRNRLRTAAAAVYVSGEAYLVQDALSTRQMELLTKPITTVFRGEPATIIAIKEEP
jgi:hypothetical protein